MLDHAGNYKRRGHPDIPIFIFVYLCCFIFRFTGHANLEMRPHGKRAFIHACIIHILPYPFSCRLRCLDLCEISRIIIVLVISMNIQLFSSEIIRLNAVVHIAISRVNYLSIPIITGHANSPQRIPGPSIVIIFTIRRNVRISGILFGLILHFGAYLPSHHFI